MKGSSSVKTVRAENIHCTVVKNEISDLTTLLSNWKSREREARDLRVILERQGLRTAGPERLVLSKMASGSAASGSFMLSMLKKFPGISSLLELFSPKSPS